VERAEHSLMKVLRSVPDFSVLDDSPLLQIVGASANLFWSAGSPIFDQDTPGEALFIVLSGRVRIYEDSAQGRVEVTTVDPGDYFGELSLLMETTHTKGAEAVLDTELLVLPKDSFRELLSEHPGLIDHFRRRLADRVPGGEIALIDNVISE
jgi:CRP-like cAMP-binding protein